MTFTSRLSRTSAFLLLTACGTSGVAPASDAGLAALTDAGAAGAVDAAAPDAGPSELRDGAVPIAATCRRVGPDGLAARYLELERDASGRLARVFQGDPDGSRAQRVEIVAWDAGGRVVHYRVWEQYGHTPPEPEPPPLLVAEEHREYAEDGRPLVFTVRHRDWEGLVRRRTWEYGEDGRLVAVRVEEPGASEASRAVIEVDHVARRATIRGRAYEARVARAASIRPLEETVEWNADGTLASATWRTEAATGTHCARSTYAYDAAGDLVSERTDPCDLDFEPTEWRYTWTSEAGVVQRHVEVVEGPPGAFARRDRWLDGGAHVRTWSTRRSERAPEPFVEDEYMDLLGCDVPMERRAPVLVPGVVETLRLAGVPLSFEARSPWDEIDARTLFDL